MALIPIPDFPKNRCSRIAVQGYTILSETELHELLSALKTEEHDKHGYLIRARGPDEDNEYDAIKESFGIDTPEGERLEKFVESFKQASDGGTPASYLHYRIAIDCGFMMKIDQALGDSELFGKLWDWARGRGGLDAWVTAGVDYPTEDYVPLLPLPIEVPSNVADFDSVEGVSLVKWKSGERRSMLYEARTTLRQDRINVGVRFRRRLFREVVSLDDVVARSMEIAGFAVTAKSESV